MTTEKKRGPGRVAEDGATGLTNRSFALTDAQRAWAAKNGGSLAIRRLIDREMAAEAETATGAKKKRAK